MSILLTLYNYVSRYFPACKTRDELLQALADEHPEKLDWRNSVVDRMKLLGIAEEDTTFEQRAQIAAYYGIRDYKGTEEQNKNLMDAITADFGY